MLFIHGNGACASGGFHAPASGGTGAVTCVGALVSGGCDSVFNGGVGSSSTSKSLITGWKGIPGNSRLAVAFIVARA